jgi:hypothetical protein
MLAFISSRFGWLCGKPGCVSQDRWLVPDWLALPRCKHMLMHATKRTSMDGVTMGKQIRAVSIHRPVQGSSFYSSPHTMQRMLWRPGQCCVWQWERQAPTPLARKACELWGRQAVRAWATLVARKCHHAIYYLGLGRLSRSRTPAPPLHLLAFGLRCIHVSFHVADACNYTSIVYSCQNTRTFRQLWFTVWPRKLRPGQLVVCTFAAGRVAL